MTTRPRHIILTGFSGTGKSAVAPLVARALGWQAIDTDTVIEEAAGKPIAAIFREDGETRFRDLEAEAVREACSRKDVVVAAGGGAVLRDENRRLMADGGIIVCLESQPETIVHRLGEGEGERPLLEGHDPLTQISELKAARQPFYALSDWTVHTDFLKAEQVAAEVVRAFEMLSPAVSDTSRFLQDISGAPSTSDSASSVVRASSRSYPVFVGWGELSELGSRLRSVGLSRQVYLISDEAVFHHYGDEVEASLRAAEIPFDSLTLPPGESTKTLAAASQAYDWLVEHKAERGHAIVALGGGMVTDLAGHIAATFARGLPLVHVPTSLLGMVDASIGGKVGVNHARAKNMIGSFYQPHFVLIDPATLRTLPPRELHSGWAEVIKHGLIADEGLLTFLEENADQILALDRESTTEAIRRSVAIKAHVVSQDEREETGLRVTLNYGHTLAHAIETATGYTRFLHGEAVAIGMTAAAKISVAMGLLSPDVPDRQTRLIERYNLPTRADHLDRAGIDAAITLDKKVRGKAVRWVLLDGIGHPVLRDDVSPGLVAEALDSVLRA